jgi:hypothetical protein
MAHASLDLGDFAFELTFDEPEEDAESSVLLSISYAHEVVGGMILEPLEAEALAQLLLTFARAAAAAAAKGGGADKAARPAK